MKLWKRNLWSSVPTLLRNTMEVFTILCIFSPFYCRNSFFKLTYICCQLLKHRNNHTVISEERTRHFIPPTLAYMPPAGCFSSLPQTASLIHPPVWQVLQTWSFYLKPCCFCMSPQHSIPPLMWKIALTFSLFTSGLKRDLFRFLRAWPQRHSGLHLSDQLHDWRWTQGKINQRKTLFTTTSNNRQKR